MAATVREPILTARGNAGEEAEGKVLTQKALEATKQMAPAN
jgi:hypothetical protein